MYCQNCGSVLGQDARFCQSCGKAQSPAQPLPPVPTPPIAAPIRAVQPQKPRSKVLWLVIGGIVLLVIIIGMLGKSPSDNSGTEKQNPRQPLDQDNRRQRRHSSMLSRRANIYPKRRRLSNWVQPPTRLKRVFVTCVRFPNPLPKLHRQRA
jgi:hypothetical protein